MIVLAVIGKILLWLLLGLLALLVLLMVVPVTASVRYRDKQFEAFVRVLFVRVRVFPMKPRKPRPEKPKAEPPPEEEEKPAKEKKKRTMGENITLFKRLGKASGAALKPFFRHARFHGVEVVVPVHAEDAATTALNCGRLQAAIGAVRAVLQGRVHVHYKKLQIIPDFAGQLGRELTLACSLSFCPGIMFVMGAAFLRSWLASRPRRRRAAPTNTKKNQPARPSPTP